MAYIIAHGTVDGYRKITRVNPIRTEQSVLTDIRAEFDNTQTMLNKPCGYLIQMADDGVWISIIKLLFDGERSGNGAGFFAFSAFIPNNQIIKGAVLKNLLDRLMYTYQERIAGHYTKNIGIDWTFVDQATAHLNEHCQMRTKVVNTNYKADRVEKKNSFAYVDISTEADIEQYLDKPFQPEYGEYCAVFLGTHLQNPNHLATQTPIAIDFDNEEYEIIWKGSGNTNDPTLPKVVRKKDIAGKKHDFNKEGYKSQTVNFQDGEIDPIHATLTLTIPKLEPVEYIVRFDINQPSQVISLEATLPYQQPLRKSEDKQTLKFYGEEAYQQWNILIKTTPEFQDYECSIYPLNDEKNVKNVSLQKLQTISLQILLDGQNVTSESNNKIQIKDKSTNKTESLNYNNTSQKWEVKVPADKAFNESYDIFPQDRQKYDCRCDVIGTNNYQIQLTTRKEPEKHFTIIVPKNITKKTIKVLKNEQELNITNQVDKEDSIEYTLSNINSPDNLKITTEDNIPLLYECQDRTIKIIRKDNDKVKKYIIVAGIIGVFVFSIVIVLGVLSHFGIIDVPIPWGTNPPSETTTQGNPPISDVENSSEEHRPLYCELDSILTSQKETWNYDAITKKVKECDSLHSPIKEDNDAYPLYKRLVWLQCRNKLNNHYIDTTTGKQQDYKDYKKWIQALKEWASKDYADPEKKDFLSEIINAEEPLQKRFHRSISTKGKEIENKTFPELQQMWKNCKNEYDKSKNSNSSSKHDQPQNQNTQNSDDTSSLHPEDY